MYAKILAGAMALAATLVVAVPVSAAPVDAGSVCQQDLENWGGSRGGRR